MTTAPDQEEYAQRQRDIEADQAYEINRLRAEAKQGITEMHQGLTRLERAVNALGSNAVYDIEVVEGRAAVTIPHAVENLWLNLAALTALVPKEDR